jgi:peroxin-5
LDSLLSLGISCTNILDEIKAMNYLKKWIICNPKYKHVNVDPNVIPDNQVDFYTYRIEDIKTANERMIGIF